MYTTLDLYKGAGGRYYFAETLDDLHVDDKECINYVFCEWLFATNTDITEEEVRYILDGAYNRTVQIMRDPTPHIISIEIAEYNTDGCNTPYGRGKMSIMLSLLSFHGCFDDKEDWPMRSLYECFDFLSKLKYQLLSSMLIAHAHNTTPEVADAKRGSRLLTPEVKRGLELILSFETLQREWDEERDKLLAEIAAAKQNTIDTVKNLVTAIIEHGEQYPSNRNHDADVVRTLLNELNVCEHIPKKIYEGNGILARMQKLGRKEMPLNVTTKSIYEVSGNEHVNIGTK